MMWPFHYCRPGRFILCAAVIVGAVAGCAGSDNPESEDDHLEHFIPAHKPHSFEELVTELSERGTALRDGSVSADSTAVTELNDIIGWLPELAADSELRKSDWERAVVASEKLQALWQERFGPRAAAAAAGGSAAPPADTGDRLAAAIDVLRSLVPASRTLPYGTGGGGEASADAAP